MSDNLEGLAGRARDDLARAVDAAAGPPPPVASVARRAARRRATHVALAVAAVLSVGSTAVWSQAGGDGPTSKVVAGQPDTPGAAGAVGGTGNRCFRPTYLPAGVGPDLRPGPSRAGLPITGPKDEVSHWGDELSSIDVGVADPVDATIPADGDSRFVVLGGDATGGRFSDAHGGRYEWVTFVACGRAWVFNTAGTTDGRGLPPGELRRVAEALVPGDPTHEDPTGVTGILYAYPSPDAPLAGADPAGPASGRVVALHDQKEVGRSVVSGNGRFLLNLPPGDYQIVGALEDGHPCGQGRVTVVKHRVRTLTFTCQRPAAPAIAANPDPATDKRDTQPAQDPSDRTEATQKRPKDPRPCSPAEFPVTARSAQEDYTGDEMVRVVYEFTNRSSSPCIFPHQSTIRIKNEAGEVVWQGMTTHDCPHADCRHIPPGETRTGGEEWTGTIPGPASEPVRVPDGLYHAELNFEVEDSENPQAEPLARYHVVTAPFRIRSQ